VNRGGCEYPMVEPSRDNPGGDCGRLPTHAAPLGGSGRWLSLCSQHCSHRVDSRPIEEVEES
jgi:hypothetical protein